MNPSELVAHQREYFNSGVTRDIKFRIEQLRLLKRIMSENEDALLDAIFADLKKSRFNTITTELALIYGEINLAIHKLPKWSAKKRVPTNLINFPGRSYMLPEPYGVTYISGTWNYPYQLTILPLVSAIAAGNTAIIKPSELTPKTSNAIAKLINENFPAEYIHVAEGGANIAAEILKQRFDKIFFTGSSNIGRIIYESAAKYLTPVTLELGGKNPAIVLPDCNIDITAKRIVWGKFANAGQTCVAADYILVHSSIEQKLLNAIKETLDRHFHDRSIEDNYMAIVNDEHMDRLVKFIDNKKLFYGGSIDRSDRYISPTILNGISFEDNIMKEEIFGPILPVIRFDNLNEAVEKIQTFDKPLSFYVFGKKSKTTDELFGKLSYGGGSLNDSVLYFVNKNLPFGGVGASGMGSYHGEHGFKTFSHFKSILEKSPLLEFWTLKVPPHKEWKLKLIRKLVE